ncbi:MAG: hypothetical protein GY842_06135 [bacterium]|nr:hypothetical protein [bacterium]
MTLQSSISGSAGRRAWGEDQAHVPPRVVGWCKRLVLHLRGGAVAGAVLVVLVHVLASTWIVPRPIAREALRNKIVALTRSSRPAILIAGDSRAERQIIPEVVAEGLSWSPDAVVNVASGACESSAVVASFREFTDRFAPTPIMVISVSIFSVNDSANQPTSLSNEVLWTLGFVDRLRLVSLPRALQATFYPEREIYRRVLVRPELSGCPDVPERGFYGVASDQCVTSTPEEIAKSVDYLDRMWFNHAVLDGVRWRQLELDLGELGDLGVQVVVLDAPAHPAFGEAIAGTRMAVSDACFHRRLADLCNRFGVPLLHYDAQWCGQHDPDVLFYDILHLNRRGAELLSGRVGRDLRTLIDEGALHLPKSGDTSTG